MKKKLTLIGHFSTEKMIYNGQTIKSTILYSELKSMNLYDICIIDTHGWKRKPFKLISECKTACKTGDYIIMMPDYNGFRIFSRLLPFFRRKKSNCKLIYFIVGGWLSEFLRKNKSYIKRLNRFDASVAETNFLKDELEELCVNNVHVIPNFKRLDIVKTVSPVAKYPYRFCLFSRIMEEKGVEDAIDCIKNINSRYRNDIVTLDIFGQIEPKYKEKFTQIMKGVPNYIRYKGVKDFNETVNVLKDYYALLFPTKYYAECMPGTVIDAFAAGIPVIGYEWKGCRDMITDGVEGWLTKADKKLLEEKIEYAINDQEMLTKMKMNCVKKAKEYSPDVNIQKILKLMTDLDK